MARKKKAAESVTVCRGADCDTALPPVVAVEPYEGFHYTTPSAQPKQGKQAKVDLGCVIKKRTRYCFGLRNTSTKSGKSTKCYATEAEAVRQHDIAGPEALTEVAPKVDDRFTGYLKSGSYDTRCKQSLSKPCGDRASCPVQLVWLDGKPNLRFCTTQDEPGYLVEVSDPQQATDYAKKACDKWPNKVKGTHNWPEKFWQEKAPQVIADSVKDYPQGGPGGGGAPGLGLTYGGSDILAGFGGGDDLDEAQIGESDHPGEGYREAIEVPDPLELDGVNILSSENILKGAAVAGMLFIAYQKFIKPMRAGASK